MVFSAHLAAGAIIYSVTDNLYLSILSSFLIHFLLDAVPHAQAPTLEGYRPFKKTYIYLALDLALSAVLFFILTKGLDFGGLGLVAIASIGPDIFDTTRYLKRKPKIFNKYYEFHDKIQKETNSFFGWATQIILIIIALGVVG